MPSLGVRSPWLTHLTLRFLYILGCSGPRCGSRCGSCSMATWLPPRRHNWAKWWKTTKIRETNEIFLMSTTVWQINDRKLKSCQSALSKLAWKNSWNHFMWMCFLRVLDLLNQCAAAAWWRRWKAAWGRSQSNPSRDFNYSRHHRNTYPQVKAAYFQKIFSIWSCVSSKRWTKSLSLLYHFKLESWGFISFIFFSKNWRYTLR